MSVGPQITENKGYSAGVGYISLVSDLDRLDYIRECYRSKTVSIKVDDESVQHRVVIPPSVLNFIQFPLSLEKRGTPIIWIREPVKGTYLIVNTLYSNEDFSDTEPGSFKFSRDSGSGDYCTFVGSEQGYQSTAVTRYLSQRVVNQNNEGEYEVEVQGTVGFKSSRLFNIQVLDEDFNVVVGREESGSSSLRVSRVQLGVSTNYVEVESKRVFVDILEDEEDETSGVFEVSSKESKLGSDVVRLGKGDEDLENEGFEPLLLGEKSIKFIEKLLNCLFEARIPTQAGMVPLSNMQEYKSMIEDLEELKSKISLTQ